ncbi:hypothetical protein EC988_001128 [Linderina pennispora]|nr:hypothetical protein EC988_001128 [Linderina pennispora]
MNFSFASAPSTPFIAQDGQTLIPPKSQFSLSKTARATDPLNDINSPAAFQYLQYMTSPLFIDSGLAEYVGTQQSSPKRAAPQLFSSPAAHPAATASAPQLLSPSAAVVTDGPLPGFVDPAEVFTTPEIRPLTDPTMTPNQHQFDDALVTPRERAITHDISAFSPQTAQTGLSLLAASATYARGANGPTPSSSQATVEIGSPFLTTSGEDATLMSQPQNSLAQHVSPPMADRGAPLGAAVMALTGRFARSTALLRNASAMSAASFHNDLVPANESFFAPLDEVCSDNEATQQRQSQRLLSPRTIRRADPRSPPMGSQFSPVLPLRQPPAPPLMPKQSGFRPPAWPTPLSRPTLPSLVRPALPPPVFAPIPSLTSKRESPEALEPLRKERKVHKRDMERRFDCDLCDRSFARQYNLKTHRLTHFPDARESRPFQCPHCTKAFTRKHDLQRHAVLHERRDRYQCDKCQLGFPRKDALKKHTEAVGH